MDRSAMKKQVILVIDLGTTNTCVKIFDIDKRKSIDTITYRSVIFYSKEGPMIGTNDAYHKFLDAPKYGTHGMKLLIGRKFDDPLIKEIEETLQIRLVNDGNNNPLIIIGDDLKKSPVEVYADYLKALKKYIEEYYKGIIIVKAVIAVPPKFNKTQRDATLQAAHQAGFKSSKLISEAEAVAIDYVQLFNNAEDEGYYLVYDLGGGFFNVSVLKINADGSRIKVVRTDGSANLAGNCFDTLILRYVCDVLKSKYDPRSDRKSMRYIIAKCQDIKQMLSTTDFGTIEVPGQPHVQITRHQFEEIIKVSLRETIRIVDNCIKDSDISKGNIKKVILAGGSTRMPIVKELIDDFFEKKVPSTRILNTDCVAEGAEYLTNNNDFSTEGKKKIKVETELPIEELRRRYSNNPKKISDFENVEFIYKGEYSCVRKANHKLERGTAYAIKEIVIYGELPQKRFREVLILQELKHTNIVKYLDAWIGETTNVFTRFSEKESVFIQMELCKCDLSRLLTKKLKTEDIMEYFKQIVCGIRELHDREIIHRDLKLSNIFMGLDGLIKVGDFGLSKSVSSELNSLPYGNLVFKSPESSSLKYDAKTDIYSLGLILFVMLKGFKNDAERIKPIEDFKILGFRATCAKEFRSSEHTTKVELIKRMTEHEPENRFSAEEVQRYIEDNWVQLIVPVPGPGIMEKVLDYIWSKNVHH